MALTPITGFALLEQGQAGAVEPPNELFARLDIAAAGIIASATTSAEPVAPAEGSLWFVPAGATGAVWAGNGGKLAARLGGGWLFSSPVAGQRVWIADEQRIAVWTGARWATAPASPGGVGFGLRVAEVEIDLLGADATAAGLIPTGATLQGVRSEVLTTVTGATGFRVGRPGSLDAHGTLTGLAAGSAYHGAVQPVTVYAATDVVVTADGADFTGGRLLLTAGFIAFD